MQKSIASMVLGVLLLPAIVFGNGQQEETGRKDGAGKIVLWDTTTLDDGEKFAIDESARLFTEKTGVELEVVHIQNDPYKTKLKVVMGSGSPPDIFHSWGGGHLKKYIDAEMVAPIDSIKSVLEQRITPAAFGPVTFNDNLYGVPYSGISGVYFWYRKDIFEKNGLETPKTWSDFQSVCRTLKNNGVIPVALANKTKWPGSFYYMYLADRIGGEDLFLNALYTNQTTFEDKDFVKAGAMIQDLAESGYLVDGFNGMDWDTGQSKMLMYSGKAAMILQGSWFYSGVLTSAPEVADKFGMFPFPEIEGGKGDPSNLIGSPGTSYFCVSAASKNKEAAKQFLADYVLTDFWAGKLAECGKIPPVLDSARYIEDAIGKQTADTFNNANHVQLFYDQYLPPAMGETHKDLVQALFGLTITPEEATIRHQLALEAGE